MHEVRCTKCNKLIFRHIRQLAPATPEEAMVEIKCKCKKMNYFKSE